MQRNVFLLASVHSGKKPEVLYEQGEGRICEFGSTMIKQTVLIVEDAVLHLFARVFEEGDIPSEWKISKVVPL